MLTFMAQEFKKEKAFTVRAAYVVKVSVLQYCFIDRRIVINFNKLNLIVCPNVMKPDNCIYLQFIRSFGWNFTFMEFFKFYICIHHQQYSDLYLNFPHFYNSFKTVFMWILNALNWLLAFLWPKTLVPKLYCYGTYLKV